MGSLWGLGRCRFLHWGLYTRMEHRFSPYVRLQEFLQRPWVCEPCVHDLFTKWTDGHLQVASLCLWRTCWSPLFCLWQVFQHLQMGSFLDCGAPADIHFSGLLVGFRLHGSTLDEDVKWSFSKSHQSSRTAAVAGQNRNVCSWQISSCPHAVQVVASLSFQCLYMSGD